MIIKIMDQSKKYTFEMIPLTQLCGLDIQKKTFILDSIVKYFSNAKYMEYEKRMIDNVIVDDEIVGRKYFQTYRISTHNDLVNAIKLGKTSLMTKYLIEMVNDYEIQNEYQKISDNLDRTFSMINDKYMNEDFFIEYEQEKMWNMIQQSEIKGRGGRLLEEMSNEELLNEFLFVLDKLQEREPQKLLIIFENIDHMLTKKKYLELCVRIQKSINKSDIWFILATSLYGYVFVNEDTIEGINVVNDEIFTFPEVEHVMNCINENYPYNNTISVEKMFNLIEKIVHNIGMEMECDLMGQVMLKIINSTMGIKNVLKEKPVSAEIHFLIE